jgi:hypothetical protein
VAAAPSEIRAIIDQLVQERQSLRASGADRPTLDANRRALAYWQLALTRSFAHDHLVEKPAA